MGSIMAYGAYMPSKASILNTVGTIAILDTAVALAAGLAIFPIVFAVPDLVPGAGPGLMFETLPVAFGNLPFGAVLGALFFLLVSFAGITSAISLTEPAIAFLVGGIQRQALARCHRAGRSVLATRHRHGFVVQRVGRRQVHWVELL